MAKKPTVAEATMNASLVGGLNAGTIGAQASEAKGLFAKSFNSRGERPNGVYSIISGMRTITPVITLANEFSEAVKSRILNSADLGNLNRIADGKYKEELLKLFSEETTDGSKRPARKLPDTIDKQTYESAVKNIRQAFVEQFAQPECNDIGQIMAYVRAKGVANLSKEQSAFVRRQYQHIALHISTLSVWTMYRGGTFPIREWTPDVRADKFSTDIASHLFVFSGKKPYAYMAADFEEEGKFKSLKVDAKQLALAERRLTDLKLEHYQNVLENVQHLLDEYEVPEEPTTPTNPDGSTYVPFVEVVDIESEPATEPKASAGRGKKSS